MLIPHRVDVLHPVWPWMNFVMIGVNVVVYLLAVSGNPFVIDYMIMDGWGLTGIFGSAVLHFDLLHIAFNLIYLWVFGNAICSKFGNFNYLIVYFGGAVFAGILHILFDGSPAVGASGAINAILGFFVVLYPRNNIHCFYLIFVTGGSFSIRAWWLIGFWFALDIYGALSGSESGIAFWAHIGGFLFGVTLGFVCLLFNWIEMSEFDNETALDMFRDRHPD